MFIGGATPLLLLALGVLWATKRSVSIKGATPVEQDRPRRPARMAAAAGTAGLIVAVSLGAANYSGVTTPVAPASAAAHQ